MGCCISIPAAPPVRPAATRRSSGASALPSPGVAGVAGAGCSCRRAAVKNCRCRSSSREIAERERRHHEDNRHSGREPREQVSRAAAAKDRCARAAKHCAHLRALPCLKQHDKDQPNAYDDVNDSDYNDHDDWLCLQNERSAKKFPLSNSRRRRATRQLPEFAATSLHSGGHTAAVQNPDLRRLSIIEVAGEKLPDLLMDIADLLGGRVVAGADRPYRFVRNFE